MMLYRNVLFLAFSLVSTGVLTYPAVGAPTVKRLGATNTGGTQINNVVPPKTTTSRASSIRTSGSYLSPKNVATSGANVSGTTTSTTLGSANSMRLSGLHGNIVKSISSKIPSNNTTPSGGANTDVSDLTNRVATLEEQMATKQETLEPGDGIDITGNTIGVTEEIALLPGKVAEMEQQIGDLTDFVDVTKYYTIDQTKTYLQNNYYTKQYVDQIVGDLANAKVVKVFDPSFLHDGQTGGTQGQP